MAHRKKEKDNWDGLLPEYCMECGARIVPGLSQSVGRTKKDRKAVCLKCAKQYENQ